MAQYFNDFSGYTSNATPSDWTPRWVTSNINWLVREVVGATGGKALEVVNSSSARHLLSWDDIDADVDRDDAEVAFRWRATDAGTINIEAALRAANALAGDATMYRFGTSVAATDGTNITEYLNGGVTRLGEAVATFLENTWYWTRARANGSLLLVRSWQDGDTEPGSFDNLVPSPQNFGTWGSNGTPPDLTGGQPDPFGGTGAFLVEDNNTGATAALSDPVTFTGDGDKGFALFIKENTLSAGGTQIIQIRDNTSGTNHHVEFTWSGGAPVISSTTNAVVLDTIAYPDGWYHMLLQATGIVAANNNVFRIFPAASGNAETGSLFVFRAGAYDETTPDPIWDIVVSDSSITAAGWVGLFSFNTGATVEVDVFAVGTAGDSAPAPVTAGGGQEARSISEGTQLGYELGFAATLTFPDDGIVLGDSFEARTPAGIQEDLSEGIVLGDNFSPAITSTAMELLSDGIVLGDSFDVQVTFPFLFLDLVETDLYLTRVVEADLEL